MAIIKMPSFGDRVAGIGSAIGTGLGELLQNLAMQKAQDYQRKNLIQSLTGFGIPEQEAIGLSDLGPDILKDYMKEFISQKSKNYQRSNLMRSLAGLGIPEQEATGLSDLGPDILKDYMKEYVGSPAYGSSIKKSLAIQPSGMHQAMQKSYAEKPIMQQQDLIGDELSRYRSLLTSAKQEKGQGQKEINKLTNDYYKEISSSARDSQANLMRLSRMSELEKSGELEPAGIYNIFDVLAKGVWGHGINLKSMLSPESQEYEKLSKDFVKNAKSVFGSRITEKEVQLFMDTIPNLSQSPEARERIIKNLSLMNQIPLIKKRAMEEIIKENNGNRPMNLEAMIDKVTKQQIDEIARRFKAGLGVE